MPKNGKRMTYYRGIPDAAKCPKDGGQMVGHDFVTDKGMLPTGEQYSYQVPQSSKCTNKDCGHVMKRQSL